MRRKEKILIFSTVVLIIVGVCTGLYYTYKNKNIKHSQEESQGQSVETSFDYDMLKVTNNLYKNKNYLISPYSMKLALSMVRDGASGETKNQIKNMIGTGNIKLLNSNKRISTANGLFVKNKYQKDILDSYYEAIKNNYNGEILYGDFITPNDINDWIYEKTYEMIKNPIKEIDPDFILGIVNAIAIDVEWENLFECNMTYSEPFTKYNNDTIDVEMMHNTYQNGIKYFKTSEEQGIILPYKTYNSDGEVSEEGISLEFVGILPNNELDSYINSFNKTTISKIDNNAKEPNKKQEIILSLPRFEYDFEYAAFKKSLINLGMKDAFVPEVADFSNIINKESIYISDAIHDTYIKLGETGTKAAAVTAFMFETNAIEEEKKSISIKFDKPFMYLIREKDSNNILFVGTVYEPNIWKGSTCEEE